MIHIQIVSKDFGLLRDSFIINPTGRICLIPEAGCINENAYCVSLNIDPTSREGCQGGGGGGDDEKEVVGHRDQEDVQAGI